MMQSLGNLNDDEESRMAVKKKTTKKKTTKKMTEEDAKKAIKKTTKKKKTQKEKTKKKASGRQRTGLMTWLKDQVGNYKRGCKIDFGALAQEAQKAGFPNYERVNKQYIWHLAKAEMIHKTEPRTWVAGSAIGGKAVTKKTTAKKTKKGAVKKTKKTTAKKKKKKAK